MNDYDLDLDLDSLLKLESPPARELLPFLSRDVLLLLEKKRFIYFLETPSPPYPIFFWY